MVTAPINHIALDERGIAYISGTRIKVSHISIEKNVWDKTPEEIQQDYPHLSLAQIHAALAYYYDHQVEIEAEIKAADQYAQEMHTQQSDSLTRKILEERLQRKRLDKKAG
ncbi:MAG TPA: DUF433 domain-containing protein [Chthonomonadaceae bacterium]|nr:DUF433 domain-containing protein [Chthonomonadaceae bacterium]